jgi:hypothetical protein
MVYLAGTQGQSFEEGETASAKHLVRLEGEGRQEADSSFAFLT